MNTQIQSDLDVWRSWDPLHNGPALNPSKENIDKLTAQGIRHLVIHRDWLGKNRAGRLEKMLESLGSIQLKCEKKTPICVHLLNP